MHKKLAMLCLQACLLLPLGMSSMGAHADEPFLGEVRWFAGNFAPRGWATCNGQVLAINQNEALFSLLGTTYGGDGRTTFALPDLRGRGMVHVGSEPGLTQRVQGQNGGTESETLTVNQLPAHTHTLRADSSGGDSVLTNDRVLSQAGRLQAYSGTANTDMDTSALTSAGGGQPHNNMQPSIALTCIIALQGIFPSRN
jgi:microcystin-dependent protein